MVLRSGPKLITPFRNKVVPFRGTPFSKPASAVASSPYLDSVLDSVSIDIDTTFGSSLVNNIATPSDGSAQSDGDFQTVGDPSFASDVYTLDSNDAIQIKTANTACIERFHKTDGTEYWFAIVFTIKGDDSDAIILATGQEATDHGFVARRIDNNDKLVMRNSNGSTRSLLSSDSNIFPAATGTFLFIYSTDKTNDRFWVNSVTAVDDTDTWVSTTTNATDLLTLLNGAGLDEGWSSTVDFKHFSCGTEYLDNTKAAAIISHLETRHGADYTP